MKKQSGITLISLAITILIILIIAGISIAGIFGQNGLIVRTREAEFKSDVSQLIEAYKQGKIKAGGAPLPSEEEEFLEIVMETMLSSVSQEMIDKYTQGNKFTIDEDYNITYVKGENSDLSENEQKWAAEILGEEVE